MEIAFWKDRANGILQPDLFSDQAEKWAKAIYENRDPRKENNKSSQIRRFYDEVLRFNTQMGPGCGPEEFQRQLPYVKMLHAKVNYAKARELVSPLFVDFIRQGVSKVETPQDLVAFKSFFEAFMGYYKVYSPK